MNPQTTSQFVSSGEANVWPPQANTSVPAYPVMMAFSPAATASPRPVPDWLDDPQTRQAYMVASVEQDIAWQVRINRERRGWTQAKLAQLIGTKQSAIARMEDPSYGKHSLATLTKVAQAFQCALLLRLVDFDHFVNETEDVREERLYVKPFEDHTHER